MTNRRQFLKASLAALGGVWGQVGALILFSGACWWNRRQRAVLWIQGYGLVIGLGLWCLAGQLLVGDPVYAWRHHPGPTLARDDDLPEAELIALQSWSVNVRVSY